MVLTFTLTAGLSVDEGPEGVRELLVAAIGCNIAWGIIDGILYLIGSAYERGRGFQLYTFVRHPGAPKEAREAIAESMPPLVAEVLQPEELESVRERITALPDRSRPPIILREDLRGAFGVFLLVVLSAFPLVVPFLLIPDPLPALRVSNAVAIGMLFLCGTVLGRHAGIPKGWTGLVMVVLGVVLVGMTIALGG
jgi:hypothetical protein